MLNVYLVSLCLINERFIYLILIIMKKQVLKSRFIKPLLQSRKFTIGAVYYRSLTLSFCFLFLSMFWVQTIFGTPVTISSTTTWDSGTTLPTGPSPSPDYREGITVTSNAQFTIDGITLTFNSGKSIAVSSGCILILTGATLTTGFNSWVGIVATGASGQEQFDVSGFPTNARSNTLAWAGTLNPSQTQIKCTDAIINKAEIGIESITGAIVRTRRGEFNNCKIGIKVGSYSSTSHSDMNACYMMRTKFIWDSNVTGIWTTSPDPIGIYLISVKGVNIGGCEFKNSDGTKYCDFSRGTGILGSNASFTVSQDGDQLCQDPDLGTSTNDCSVNCLVSGTPQNCKFEGLTYGINTNGNSSPKEYRLGIRDSEFKDILYSIVNHNAIHVLVYKCSFTATRTNIGLQYKNKNSPGNSSCDYDPHFYVQFINNVDASSARVVNNGTLSFDGTEVIYVRMENTENMKSLFQGNILSNISTINGSDNVYGLYAIGSNRHLDIKCNTFTNLSTDIYIGQTTTAILKNQTPTSTSHDDNNFSSTSGNSRINIYNFAGATTFILHYDQNDPVPTTYGNVTVIDKPNANGCSIDNGCEGLTEELSVKNSKNSGFEVYPNPAQNVLNFTSGFQQYKNVYAQLYDLVGNKISEIDLTISQQMDVSKLDSGLYFILIQNGSSVYSSKIVIQK